MVGFGQNLPKNPVPGKCYERCFDYEAKFEWKEINCDSIKPNKPRLLIRGEEAVSTIKRNIKFKKYQEKLKKLGYDLEVTCKFDDKTIAAHHQYLIDKKKSKKLERKRLKKAKRDSLKQIKLQNKRLQKGF